MELIDIIRSSIELFFFSVLTLFFGSYSLYVFKKLKTAYKTKIPYTEKNPVKDKNIVSKYLRIPVSKRLNVINKNESDNKLWDSLNSPLLIPVKSDLNSGAPVADKKEMFNQKFIWK